MDWFIFIWFIIGAVAGYIMSRNFIVSMLLGAVSILVYMGIITIGFDWTKLVPKLW